MFARRGNVLHSWTIRVMLICGVVVGVMVGTWTRHVLAPCVEHCCLSHDGPDPGGGRDIFGGSGAEAASRSPEPSQRLVIGVMTARKYLRSRVVAAWRTWAQDVPATVVFFSSEDSSLPDFPQIPIVSLPGVDDTYPPQRKSFAMLRWLYRHFGRTHAWFMRADDDVYVRGDRLTEFLSAVNSSRPLYIGQAGLGNKREFGQLRLRATDNFCMGGPGVVLSRVALRSLVPHLERCLSDVLTTHEDVELGRCVRRFVGISCTWSFEMQHLFFQNFKDSNGSFAHSLRSKRLEKSVTLHPVKNHTWIYRLHAHFLSLRAAALRHRRLVLHRRLAELESTLNASASSSTASWSSSSSSFSAGRGSRLAVPPSLQKRPARDRKHVADWEFMTNRALYSHTASNPRRSVELPLRQALDDVVQSVMVTINRNSRQRGRTIDFKDLLYGYRRLDVVHGADYVLDMLLTYRKHKGHKMTLPVRRHAYVQQAFGELEMRVMESAEMRRGPRDVDVTVNIILPLADRFRAFALFAATVENEILPNDEYVSLSVMLFRGESDENFAKSRLLVEQLQTRHPRQMLRVVPMTGSFSRAAALQQGANMFPSSALIFFVDVDIRVSVESVARVRLNTLPGRQLYFPIVFSQYDPRTGCGSHFSGNTSSSSSSFAAGFCDAAAATTTETNSTTKSATSSESAKFDQTIGYWRRFGFGIASVYVSDLESIGGFDTSITGWGKEDVDLYVRALSTLDVMRAPDPGLTHLHHAIHCDSGLEPAQLKMCRGSQAATLGATVRLAQLVMREQRILQRNSAAADVPGRADEQMLAVADEARRDQRYDEDDNHVR